MKSKTRKGSFGHSEIMTLHPFRGTPMPDAQQGYTLI